MCLYSKTEKPKKAKEDIICYKFLVMKNGCLQSPYLPFVWSTDKEYTAEKSKMRWPPKDIKDGYFHTYKEKDAAMRQAEEWIHSHPLTPYPRRLYECVIPKDSYYFEGVHFGVAEGYASKKLIIKKKVG